MPDFDINTDEIVGLANRLEKLHKSALPVAVRQTLNDAAFEAKQKHLPRVFESAFIARKKTFITSHSSVNKSSNTFNISQMASEMGIIKGKSDAGDEMDKQEFGGAIQDRTFIPMDESRVSGNKTKLISRKNYLKNIKTKKGKHRFKNQELIRTAFRVGKNGHLIYENILFQVRRLVKKTKNKIFIKLKPLYSYKKGRSVNLSKKPFIAPSGEMAAKNIPNIFLKNASYQINRYL